MFNLQTYNQEMEKEFDEDFKWESADEFKSFLTSSHKQLLKQFLEGEVEQEEKNLEAIKDTENDFARGMRFELASTLTRYQSLLSTLGDN